MVTIKAGDTFRAEGVKTGTSAKGDYFLCKVSDDKGKKKITVWNNDGFTCADGDTVTVDEIVSVKLSASKGRDDKWYDNFDAVCRLSLAQDVGQAFTDLSDDGTPLPF